MKNFYKTLVTSCMGVGLLFLAGCATTNHQDLTVSLSKSLSKDAVQVDVAGLKEGQVAEYYNIDSSQYWALDSKYRNSLAKRTIVFYPGKSDSVTINDSSPIWDMWDLNGQTFLLVAVDLPPTVGNSINWKLILPIPYYSAINFWSSRNDKFVVDQTGLTYVD